MADDQLKAATDRLNRLAQHNSSEWAHYEDIQAIRHVLAQVKRMERENAAFWKRAKGATSAGFRLAHDLCLLPEDDADRLSRRSVMDCVVRWRTTIDALAQQAKEQS